MFSKRTTSYLGGLMLVLAIGGQTLAQTSGSNPGDARTSAATREKARKLIDLEMVFRAEQRVQALRDKLFDLHLKEIELHESLEEMDYRLTPLGIRAALAFVGSVRPMDELREALRSRLDGIRDRLNTQLELTLSSRERYEAELVEAEADLDRIRHQQSLW